ncbi:MAG: hypothetical protein HYX42_17380 [Polaromonas sp.]|uniref:hypothetical protein n=1 Tax=Polaromonas sp. TaxID=1869339 RepID=UPI0025D52439|nr:hypothetical protein [Polaromonas sp.]MBI2728015.1 hypothetical protein [Polaromonas sp.]
MRTKTAFLLPAVLTIAALLAACEQKPEPVATSLSARIASVDAGAARGEDDPASARARKALAATAQACRASELQVAEMIAKVRKVLVGEGKTVVMTELLEATPALLADAAVDADTCQKLYAAYTVARQGGQNHEVALAAVKIRK